MSYSSPHHTGPMTADGIVPYLYAFRNMFQFFTWRPTYNTFMTKTIHDACAIQRRSERPCAQSFVFPGSHGDFDEFSRILSYNFNNIVLLMEGYINKLLPFVCMHMRPFFCLHTSTVCIYIQNALLLLPIKRIPRNRTINEKVSVCVSVCNSAEPFSHSSSTQR